MACTSFGQVNKPTWTLNWEFFTAKGSTVEVRVRAMARTSNQPQEYYSLQVVCRATCPELTEEVGFLQVVTHDMEDRNVPPERLAIILLDLCGPDVSKYLSIDALQFKCLDWRRAQRLRQAHRRIVECDRRLRSAESGI